MNRAHVLYHMVRADFLERVRRYSFLMTMAFAIYLAYAAATGKIVLSLDQYRGLFNSAWVGSMMTLVSTTFLSLVGFYIVKNAILRDEQTRVGNILASTPMSRSFYTLAKALSNFAVLALMITVLAVAAVIMQLTRAEDGHFQLGTLLAPFLWVGLPAMAITAAVAVLFETLPILRSGAGNVIYFFAWVAGIALGVDARMDDFIGFNVIGRSMQTTLKALDPTYKQGISLTISSDVRTNLRFLWTGVAWTPAVVFHRLLWVAAAVGVSLAASLFFHRFDPAWEWSFRGTRRLREAASGNGAGPVASVSPERQHLPGLLTPLTRKSGKTRLLQLVGSELRLMLKGLRWWWYAVALGLIIGELAAPTVESRGGVLVAAWIWPVLVWSQMGAREARYATQSLIFSSERALRRQLPAVWIAGVVVAILTGAGVGNRLLLAADWHGLIPWLAGALFIPSLALCLGVWSGTSKPFEAIYTVWWYIGPANRTPGLDFMGTTAASSKPTFYFLFGLGLVVASYFGRRLRVAYA